MIKKFVELWENNKASLKKKYSEKAPESYQDIFKDVVELLNTDYVYSKLPDPKRITFIDHGDYKGTHLFVVADDGYQPSKYWYVMQSYGSCSGCDTYQHIRDSGSWTDGRPNDEQVKEYMELALHMVQGMKEME